MTQEFFTKIVQLFRDNLDKVEIFKSDEHPKTLSLVMFRPFIDNIDDVIHDLTGFRVNFDIEENRIKFEVVELAFKNLARNWNPMDVPIEVIIINNLDEESSTNYNTILRLLQEVEDYQKKAEEEKRSALMQEFMSGSLTFINPIETLMKEVQKKSKVGNFQQEPSIMSFERFDEEEEFNEDDDD